jgi:hypothetical protein
MLVGAADEISVIATHQDHRPPRTNAFENRPPLVIAYPSTWARM